MTSTSIVDIVLEDREVLPLPRVAWLSQGGGYRLVITDNGPSNALTAIYDGPSHRFWALEVIDGYDLLGEQRWRSLDRNNDQRHWHYAFREIAAEMGLLA